MSSKSKLKTIGKWFLYTVTTLLTVGTFCLIYLLIPADSKKLQAELNELEQKEIVSSPIQKIAKQKKQKAPRKISKLAKTNSQNDTNRQVYSNLPLPNSKYLSDIELRGTCHTMS